MLSKMIEHFIFKGFQGCLKITKKSQKTHVFFTSDGKLFRAEKSDGNWPKLHDLRKLPSSWFNAKWVYLQYKFPFSNEGEKIHWTHGFMGERGPLPMGFFLFHGFFQQFCFSGAAWRMIMYMSNAMHLLSAACVFRTLHSGRFGSS